MIPFARVLKYGNTAVNTIKIKKIRFAMNSTLALSRNGELYGRGAGAFGDGNGITFRDDWVLVRENVEDFWCNENQQAIYIRTSDKKILWCGSMKYRTGSSDTSFTSTFQEESILTTQGVRNIIFNESYTSILALSTAGSAYLIGSPRSWNGVTTVNTAWTLMGTGITSIMCTSTNYFTVMTNGVVNGGGQNIANILNATASTSNFYVWPINIGTARVSSPSITVGQYAIKFMGTSNTMLGRGYGFGGFFGYGSNQDITNTATISSSWPNFSSMIRQSDIPQGAPNKSYYYTSTKLYFMGMPSRSGSTSTSTVYSPEEISVPFSPGDIIYIQVAGAFVYIYLSTGKIYQAGVRYTNSGVFVDYAQFTEVESSYFDKFSIDVTRNEML